MSRTLLTALALTLLCTAAAFAAADPASPVKLTEKPAASSMLLAYGDVDIWDETGQIIKKPAGGDKMTQSDIAAQTPDPLEGWNRMWFTFNDKLYFWALKPVAQGYGAVIPERPRIWVGNFFHNLMYPVRFVSLMLQGKPSAAAVETSRFIGNTAFGLGGLADITADSKPFKPIGSTEKDLGLTFGYWGAGNGLYLVWPFLGPSSGRDTLGYAGDYFLTPTSYIHPWYWSIATKGYDKINEVSMRIGDYETLKDASVDPYEAVRDAYLRNRFKKIND
ncbi:MAG: VacJ family lipoprotein [Proteobacteria bacterium]|nr:VacJ family lipoprotein [Pseudomonadota bacterium]